MAIRRFVRGGIVLNLALLFTLAFWLRINSLNMPSPNGDEAFYGVQVARLLQGQSIARTTASGNVLNLLVVGAELPLYLTLGPSPYTLKIPAAFAGTLAVIAAYFLFAPSLGRTTSLIATTLLAVLPVAIIECRVGCEPAWNPLVGVIGLSFAFRGHRLGTLLSFLLCYYVHPTYLFLLPVFLLVLGARVIQRNEGDWQRSWRELLSIGIGTLVVIGPLAWHTWRRSAVQWLYETFDFGPCDWSRFFILYERMLMGFCECGWWETSTAFDRLFWGVVLSVLALGSWRLWKGRRWNRLALLVGLAISLSGLHLVNGPDILRPYFVRYGLFLVAPSVIGFACLLEALLVSPSNTRREILRFSQMAVLLAMAWVILFSVKRNFFDVVIAQHEGRVSLWTLRTESIDPKAWLNNVILADIERAKVDNPPGSARKWVVLAEDWWTHRPLEFLSSHRDDVVLISLEGMDAPTREALFRKHLPTGAYVVGTMGKEIEAQIQTLFPPEDLRHWHVQAPPHEGLALYRFKRDGEVRTSEPIIVLNPYGNDAHRVVR